MPTITFSATADEINDEDELFELFKALREKGYRGSVSCASLPTDPDGDAGWRMQAFIAAETPGGVDRAIEAHVGDMRVDVNGAINVMTKTEYAATYGGTAP